MSLFRNPPETRYADTGEGFVGYTTIGDGPPDILFLTQIITNVEVMWDSPHIAGYFDQLSALGRVIVSEYRGTGISDPFPFARNPNFDDFIVDGLAVMEAAGSERVTLIGDTEGGPMAILIAATHPEKIERLILLNSFARFIRTDDYPIGMPEEVFGTVREYVKSTWGKPEFFTFTAPSHAEDKTLLEWLARYQRLVGSPDQARRMLEWFKEVDVRAVLPNITVPTLIITHTDGAYHRASYSRYLAENIPNSKLVEFPGRDTAPYFLADPKPVLAEIEEFLTGQKAPPTTDRVMATVMITDIVRSTQQAVALGDQKWLDLLDQHHELAKQYVLRFGGTPAGTTGDGVVAMFDGPTKAVACAIQLSQAMAGLGLEIRAGLHAGEVDLQGPEEVSGLAVHIAARVMAQVPGSGVAVSRTIRDLVAGSGIELTSLGEHQLKGVPGEWEVLAVEHVPPAFRLSL